MGCRHTPMRSSTTHSCDRHACVVTTAAKRPPVLRNVRMVMRL